MLASWICEVGISAFSSQVPLGSCKKRFSPLLEHRTLMLLRFTLEKRRKPIDNQCIAGNFPQGNLPCGESL